MRQDRPISLWDATAEEADTSSPLAAGKRVDVAVVGGGFTGLSTALHAAERGLSVQVIEARHIGFGGSGRNVGLVNAGVWLPPDAVRAALGEATGKRFLERFGEAPDKVFDLIERYQIRCEPVRNGTVHAAHSASGFRDLQRRHGEWQRLGAPVELLGREEVAAVVGTDRYVGGLLDHRAGTINPMGYCRGLARAATGAGAAIATGVRAARLSRGAGIWRVDTDHGPIEARAVVLATNAYTDRLWPGLERVFSTIHFLQFATPPLGASADGILPGRQGLWDTAPIMFSYRRDAAGRLLVGTMGRLLGNRARGLSQRWAERQIRRTFPALGDVTFENAWHGRIAMTPDHLPRIHRLDEGLWTAIGYNGRGITTGTILGRELAGLVAGDDPADLSLPVTPIRAAPRAALSSAFYDLAFTANQIWKGI